MAADCFLCNEPLGTPSLPLPKDFDFYTGDFRMQQSRTLIRLLSFIHQYDGSGSEKQSSRPPSVSMSIPRRRPAISDRPKLRCDLETKLQLVNYCVKCTTRLQQLDQTFKEYDSTGQKLEEYREELIGKILEPATDDDCGSLNSNLRAEIVDGFRETGIMSQPPSPPPSTGSIQASAPSHHNQRSNPVIKLQRLEHIPALAHFLAKPEPAVTIKQESVEDVELYSGTEIGSQAADHDSPDSLDFGCSDFEPDTDSECDVLEPPSRKKLTQRKRALTAKVSKTGKTPQSKSGTSKTDSKKSHKKSRLEKLQVHPCDYDGCGEHFETAHALEKHVTKSHAGIDRAWHCNQSPCTAQFFKESSLTHHTHYVHSTTYKYPCPKCLAGFNNYEKFLKHQQLNHRGEPSGVAGKPVRGYHSVRRKPKLIPDLVFPCDYEDCEFQGHDEWETQDHFQDSHRNIHRPHKCFDCGAKFLSEQRLARHKHWVHSTVRYRCQECDFSSNIADKMQNHRLREHGLGETCPYEGCAYVGTKDGLARHLETSVHADRDPAHGQRKHICEHCGEKFLRSVHLNYHIYARHPEHVRDPEKLKLYRCEQCGKQMCDPPSLRTHIRVVHNHEGDFHCDQCGKNFINMSQLRHHSRLHLTPDQFEHECKTCHAKFRDRAQLNAHMRRHTGDFKHICKECGKKFTNSGALKRHVKIHAGILEHICPHCQKGFPVRDYLRIHLKSHLSQEEKEERKRKKPKISVLQQIYHDVSKKGSSVASLAADRAAPQPVEIPAYPVHYEPRGERKNLSRVLQPEEIGIEIDGEPQD